ncbi:hypothetical protein GW17_00008650 [Ensete ventricosum]|nr:hypothetical protein GW17_00008650 [Ensete ventricosum]
MLLLSTLWLIRDERTCLVIAGPKEPHLSARPVGAKRTKKGTGGPPCLGKAGGLSGQQGACVGPASSAPRGPHPGDNCFFPPFYSLVTFLTPPAVRPHFLPARTSPTISPCPPHSSMGGQDRFIEIAFRRPLFVAPHPNTYSEGRRPLPRTSERIEAWCGVALRHHHESVTVTSRKPTRLQHRTSLGPIIATSYSTRVLTVVGLRVLDRIRRGPGRRQYGGSLSPPPTSSLRTKEKEAREKDGERLKIKKKRSEVEKGD